jgi:hypothetical protein
VGCGVPKTRSSLKYSEVYLTTTRGALFCYCVAFTEYNDTFDYAIPSTTYCNW